MRADARRNREHVLRVAGEIFAAEGLSVPVHEIARRAGVGTGTVSRHFPTKDDLFKAIIVSRIERIVAQARTIAETKRPGPAFYEFFAMLVEEGAANRGIMDAFTGAGFDLEAAASGASDDVIALTRDLLAAAQQAGAVRADVDAADVKALLNGCLSRDQIADSAARARLVAIVAAGLRPTGDQPGPRDAGL